MVSEAPVFDEVIHAPHRLRICAMLGAAHKVEFGLLQQRLGLSKSALSKHLTQLAEAGYVRQDRATRDARSRLRLSLTPRGARAYAAHVQALQQIISTEESRSPAPAAHGPLVPADPVDDPL